MKRNLLISTFLILSTGLFLNSSYAFELKSSAFKDGEFIPSEYTGTGADVSPELLWSGFPKETKSFVLIMDDPDAPLGTWVHWVIFNIPHFQRGLMKNVPRKNTLDDGSRQGLNSFRWVGYSGPLPPHGATHRYFFRIYALDIDLDLPPASNKGRVVRAMQGHILDKSLLIGKFSR